MLRVSSNTSLIAAQTASVSTDDPVVDQLAGQAEGLLADLLDGRAVGEQADVGELRRARPARTERSIASESFICTPMTWISGRTALT